ncbi:integrase core domain-containing protein [Actinomyces dentalis]|uniref:integrase core domain-containing protein n=1 Tax=Actinomyces dentalis TaxID=272548 RepID=UPI00042035AE
MSGQNPRVDPRVRLAIAQWPDDAPRGAVSAFCAEQGISRKTFYAIRARARSEGPAAALEPRSTRPAPGPTRIGQEMVLRALAVRSALESSGLDHGPISVHDKMRSMGLEAPSPASPARIFRRKGVARSEPRKRPRSAWRRFVYPAPNARRRLDATEYVLAGGRKAVIFQLQDDHSRLAVASLVAPGETSDAAIAVFDKGVAAHGVPQRLLTDNGAALNPSRRGHAGRLVEHVRALGVEPITGRPRKPTTQGKNERFHQTLLRYLDKQPPAESIADLQAQVDAFDRLYNTRRPHQGLPGRITPQQAWDATPVADPPRPDRVHDEPALTTRKPPARSRTPRRGERRSRIRANGTVTPGSITFLVSRAHAGCDVEITRDPDTVVFATPDGQVLVQHTWPAPGVTYVSTHGPDPTNSRGGRGRKKTRLSPMS